MNVTKENKVLGWHWLRSDGLLRDGSTPPPDGEWLVHPGDIKLCRSGLHWCRSLIRSLYYAPGRILCRIESRGDTVEDQYKCVSRERRILWRMLVPKDLLYKFARKCCLDIYDPTKYLTKKDANIVLRYLKTADSSLRHKVYRVSWHALHRVGLHLVRDNMYSVKAINYLTQHASISIQHTEAIIVNVASSMVVTEIENEKDIVDTLVVHNNHRDIAVNKLNKRLISMVIAEAKRQGVYK